MSAPVRLSVPSEARSPAIAQATTLAFAAGHGLDREVTAALNSVVQGLLKYVLEHAYPDDTTGEVELALGFEPDGVLVTVHDWGLPMPSFGGGLNDPPADVEAAAQGAQDLRLVNLGADGKRWSAVVPALGATATAPSARAFGASPRAVAPGTETQADEVTIRGAGSEDAEAISRLLFANYGLTYGHPDFYRPRWLGEEIRAERVVPTVAVHAGEIVGHHALVLDPSEGAGETGIAVVHPAYRGLGLFNRLSDHTLAVARERDVPALFGRAVTVHPYSQRAERAHGYVETALLLGAVPATMAMRDIPGAEAGRRSATLVAYRALADPGARAITIPPRFDGVLRAVYGQLRLAVGLPGVERATVERPAIDVRADLARGTTLLRIRAWGADGPAALLRELHMLTRRRDDVLYVDLDLHTLDAAELEEALDLLAARYFFLAGLMPFGENGHDRLRLQRLQTEAIEIEGVVVDSEHAQALRDAVLTDRAHVCD